MLKAENLTVSYGDRDVLSDVSLELPPGQMIALLGANGAGKTTLIRTLNGTTTLSTGRIWIDGVDLQKLSRRKIARQLAVVAQENETRFPTTVVEFVLAGRYVHGGSFGWETPEDIAQARKAIAECDLSSYELRLMNELSGGERQRVVLARALATEAAILLLDEPTANLDLAHQASMFRLIRGKCDTAGYSAVVITHDLNLAAEFADRVIMLKKGRVAATGAPEDVLTSENLESVFEVETLLDKNPSTGKVRVTTLY